MNCFGFFVPHADSNHAYDKDGHIQIIKKKTETFNLSYNMYECNLCNYVRKKGKKTNECYQQKVLIMQQSDPSQCYKLYKYIVYYWIFIAAAFLRGETIQNFIYISSIYCWVNM